MKSLIYILAVSPVLLGNVSRVFASEGDAASNGEEAAMKPKGPEITPRSWLVSATTHMPKQLPHALAKDLTKQANYIHWTCYRQEPTLPTDKLHCCQEIYQVQEKDPFHLCWKKRSCLKDKVGRSEFMHYCTEQIVTLNLGPSNQSVQPRFSLLIAPQLPDLQSDKWRQYVSFDSSQGGHWVYNIESPFRLSMDPNAFVGSPADSSSESPDAETSGEFDAVLSSAIHADADDDDDFREFKQKLTVSFPEDTEGDGWKVSAEVILYLPEPAGLRKRKLTPQCKGSSGECHLEIIDDTENPLDQQYLIRTIITLPNVPSTGTVVEWSYHIALDDDNIILPAPFIYTVSAVQEEQGKTLKWIPKAMEKVAFPTALDEHDEL